MAVVGHPDHAVDGARGTPREANPEEIGPLEAEKILAHGGRKSQKPQGSARPKPDIIPSPLFLGIRPRAARLHLSC